MGLNPALGKGKISALNLFGLVKELAYDPDGLSRSDTLSNGLGLVLELPVELEFF